MGTVNVRSLTDILLQTTYNEYRLDGMTCPEKANQSISLMEYRLTTDRSSFKQKDPSAEAGELYEVPELDIYQVSSAGIAMAMLIITAMQNEGLVDTQLEGVKCTQNQKLAASSKKMQEIREQVRQSRYQSGFEKFMEWLNDTWVMKFLNSNYGKVAMFLIGAFITAASLGSAAPVTIAISTAILAYQAADLVVSIVKGKSIVELATENIENEKLKMAVQIGVQAAIVIASMGAGMGSSSSSAGITLKAATEATEIAKKTEELGQQATRLAQTLQVTTEVTGQVETAAELTAQVSSIASRTSNIGTALVDNTMDAAQLLQKVEKLREQVKTLADTSTKLTKGMESIDKLTESLKTFGDTAEDIVKSSRSFLEQSSSIVQDGMKQSNEVMRLLKRLTGGENLSIFQRFVVNVDRFQRVSQIGLEFYGAAYNFARTEESTRDMLYKAQIDHINGLSKAQQELYQNYIDNQLSDIETLMSYTQASYERAASAIKEYGDTSTMIARNIAV